MGKVIRRTVILCGVSVLVFSSLSFAQDGATAQVKGTIDKVLDILRDPALKGPEKDEVRGQQLRKVIFTRFDFPEMARRCLGVHWRNRTPQERKEFVDLFSDLLEQSYRNKIERYTDQVIQYTGEQVEDSKFGVVNTEIVDKRENLEIPIDYKVIRHGEDWKVYDVVIDGISLVSNYRSQFNRIIQRGSFDELVKRMRARQEAEEMISESPKKER
ncbi:MAG: phospholipid-binding protein MlaC [Candidatus Methylomirabilales bacterium]